MGFLFKHALLAPTAVITDWEAVFPSGVVPENEPVPVRLAVLSSNGSPSLPVTYSIAVGGDPSGKFSVIGDELWLDEPLDYDVATSHTLVLRAATSAGSVNTNVTVTVGDVTSASPAIASQTADFGALTLANAGIWYPPNTGGAIVTSLITGGTLATGNAWTIDNTTGGLKRSSTTPAMIAGTLICSYTNAAGTDTATITINPIANAYSVANNTEFAAVINLTDAVRSGKKCMLRYSSTVYVHPSLYQKFTAMTDWFEVTSHDQNKLATMNVFRPNTLSNAPVSYIRLSYLRFKTNYQQDMGFHGNMACNHLHIHHCDFVGDCIPGRLNLGTTMPNGIDGRWWQIQVAGNSQDVTIEHNTFFYAYKAMSISGNGITIRYNWQQYCWDDFINMQIILTGTTGLPTQNVTIAYNVQSDHTNNGAYTHPDFLQTAGANNVYGAPFINITVKGNICFIGWEGEKKPILYGANGPGSTIGGQDTANVANWDNGPLCQFLILQNQIGTTGNDTYCTYDTWIVDGNVQFTPTFYGIVFQYGLTGISSINNNTIARWWVPDGSPLKYTTVNFQARWPAINASMQQPFVTATVPPNGNTPVIDYAFDEDVVVANNVAEGISQTTVAPGVPYPATSAPYVGVNNDPNLAYNSFASYTDRFQGTTMRPSTYLEALNEARIKVGGPLSAAVNGVADIGAVGTTLANGYIDWTAVPFDNPAAETRFNFTGLLVDLTGRVAGSTVVSDLITVTGVTGTGVEVKANRGEMRVTDAAGTVWRDWQPAIEPYNVINGFVFQLRDVAPASGVTRNLTVNCGSYSDTWSITSA